MTPQFFRINDTRVAHQLVDGEVIAIDFECGTYFSMRGTAADIWSMLAAGASLEEVLTDGADIGGDVAREEINAFIASVVAANLLSPSAIASATAYPSVRSCGVYTTPVLEKFEDMAELIKLDPIHEVNEMMGWPHVAQPAQ